MTNADLQKKYSAIFPVHILFNNNGKTILAGTQYQPNELKSCFAYAPMLDDFTKVPAGSVVATIRIKNFKSKA